MRYEDAASAWFHGRPAAVCVLLACWAGLPGAGAAVAQLPPASPATAAPVPSVPPIERDVEATRDLAVPRPPLPTPADLEASGATIGEVIIRVRQIFDPTDPKEDRRLFRLANRLHRRTRDQVIRDQLLFKTGDRFSQHALDESARLLRKNRYLYDVDIRPVRYEEGRVVVEVATRDVWTLNAGVGLGRSGGANTTRFLLQDTNFLGTGKRVTLERETNVDRTTSLFQYDDKALFGTHGQLSLAYGNNSDGKERSLVVAEPFYSLDTRWAADLTAATTDRVDSLYALGHVADRFHHRVELFEVHGGLSRGLSGGWARRIGLGFTSRRDLFDPASGFPPPDRLPADRKLSYPWISFDLVQDIFETTRNFDQIQRTEDLHLGSQAHLRLGFASASLGSDRDAAVFDSTASTGWKPAPNHTVLLSAGLVGRWEKEGARNVDFGTSLRYYWRDFGEQLFFVTFSADVARHLDADNQLLLGGDTGLRGYPLRYQDGDRRALLTVEQRFFTNYYPFRLIRIGGAAFADVGRTWRGESGLAKNFGLLRDVGIGLRLASSRSGLGNVTHVDLAFPLDGDP
ncbi:MAG TPA: POTRA domain-containing protein, partial [Thermoanaerobaculia bacterium]|nr:POTRA domain-containing protein [Thermoanaerobaculia bacterium]